MIAGPALTAQAETAVTLIMGAGALVTAVAAVAKTRRTASPLPLWLLLGSILTFFLESVPITLGHLVYPMPRVYPGFVTLKHALPLFVMLSYIGYWTSGIGALVDRIARPTSAAEWLRLYLIFVAIASIFEMVFIRFGFWTYYGAQPLQVAGLPLAWGFVNMHALFAGAVVISMVRTVLPLWLLPPLIPCLLIGTQTIAGLPMYLALNSSGDLAIRTIGALGSIAVSLLLLVAQGRLLAARPAPNQPEGQK